MPNLLKNFLLSAALVAAATVASVSLAGVTTLLVESANGAPVDPRLVSFGTFVMMWFAAAAGVFFAVITLIVAALTMPLTLWLARKFGWPRPLTDMLGGVAAGLLCATFGLDILDSWGALASDARTLIFTSIGALGGAVCGFCRYLVLGRPAMQPPGAAQFA